MAINETYMLCPWADYLFASDTGWWDYYAEHVGRVFLGECYTISETATFKRPYPKYLRGLNREHSAGGLYKASKDTVYNGGNSGHMALNLAYHLGYDRIILVGFDMKPGYWFRNFIRPKSMRQASSYVHFNSTITAIVRDLLDAGVLVYNCTPNSSLDIEYTDIKTIL